MCPECKSTNKQSVIQSIYKNNRYINLLKCLMCGVIYENNSNSN